MGSTCTLCMCIWTHMRYNASCSYHIFWHIWAEHTQRPYNNTHCVSSWAWIEWTNRGGSVWVDLHLAPVTETILHKASHSSKRTLPTQSIVCKHTKQINKHTNNNKKATTTTTTTRASNVKRKHRSKIVRDIWCSTPRRIQAACILQHSHAYYSCGKQKHTHSWTHAKPS